VAHLSSPPQFFEEEIMKRILGIVALSVCLTAASAFAAPGDPFGGSETGCVPSGKAGLTCGKILTSGLGKLVASVVKCHLTQAAQAYKTGHSSTGFDNAEENCTIGNPTASAKAKFDALLVKANAICPAGIVPVAEARRDVFLGDTSIQNSLDSINGVFFCDATSGLSIAEPGGGDQDEAGSIPSTPEHYKCSVAVAKLFSKLVTGVYKCHVKAAQAIFAGKPHDTDACEETPTKGALAKYEAKVQKLITAGICPPCLADPMSGANALAMGAGVIAELDAQNEEVYPCPAP
jgi:hypothetical protein